MSWFLSFALFLLLIGDFVLSPHAKYKIGDFVVYKDESGKTSHGVIISYKIIQNVSSTAIGSYWREIDIVYEILRNNCVLPYPLIREELRSSNTAILDNINQVDISFRQKTKDTVDF